SVSFEAQSKVYDALTTAARKLTPVPSLVGLQGTDSVDLDYSGASYSFANKNVGTNKTVTGSGFTKSGTDAGNYVFASPQGTALAYTTLFPSSVSFEAQSKVYD